MCDIMTSSSNCAFPLFVSKSSIGYPVVYLGFDATCYFTNIFKLRIQKAVQSENDFHMHLLQHSLPPGLQVYPKTGTDGGGGKLSSPSITTHTHTHTHPSLCDPLKQWIATTTAQMKKYLSLGFDVPILS